MVEVRQTEVFSKWLRELRDRRARAGDGDSPCRG
jgi:putative component of toxin-antitoxin plasmid stabilization module